MSTRVDLHVKVLNETVVRRAKERDIDVLVYAPHFERLPDIEETASAFTDDELLVVPAREIFTGSWRNRKHVLALGLTDPIPDFITLSRAMDALKSQRAAVLAPHPDFLTVSLEEPDFSRYESAIDAVEVYNPKHLPSHNDGALDLARTNGFPTYGSSYAHLPGTVGEVWTTFERPIASTSDLVDALRNGESRQVERRNGLGHQARCTLEFAHLGYENSWKKIDRLFLSGMEPTHPDHIAYDGAYDDASVY